MFYIYEIQIYELVNWTLRSGDRVVTVAGNSAGEPRPKTLDDRNFIVKSRFTEDGNF